MLTNLTKFMIDESRTLNVFELVYDIDDLLATMMMLTMIMMLTSMMMLTMIMSG